MDKIIYSTKIIYDSEYSPTFEKIREFIKKYFNDNDLIIVQDDVKGWYNFKIGSRKYNSNINEINKKYKVYIKEGYWYFEELRSDVK